MSCIDLSKYSGYTGIELIKKIKEAGLMSDSLVDLIESLESRENYFLIMVERKPVVPLSHPLTERIKRGQYSLVSEPVFKPEDMEQIASNISKILTSLPINRIISPCIV